MAEDKVERMQKLAVARDAAHDALVAARAAHDQSMALMNTKEVAFRRALSEYESFMKFNVPA